MESKAENREKNSTKIEPSPLLFSCRFNLAIISFLGFTNLYALRVNMSVAMVCMLNETALQEITDEVNNATSHHVNTGCSISNETSKDTNEDGDFVWNKEIQGLVLGSFFWGYIITQIPGGWLATRFGGKRVYGYCMLICAIATLLMPVAARADYRFLAALRILAGLCQGVVWPAMQSLWATWAPPLENGKLGGFCYAGAQMGNILTFPIAGLLCAYGFDGGWPSIFYILGALGILWFLGWMYIVADTPQQHPRITIEERNYITKATEGTVSSMQTTDIKWKELFTSKCVLAIYVAHTCANWGTYTFLTNIPTYMREVLRFDIKENGFLSALPYIVYWLTINAGGVLADFLRSRELMSTTKTRKILNTIGQFGPAIFVVATGFVDCHNAVLAVALLTIGIGLSGCQYPGFLVNPGDVAPRYAGIIFGISNTFATVPGILAPLAISYITVDQTQEQWRTVFFICAGIYIVGCITYLSLGSGVLQEWARDEDPVELIVTPDPPAKHEEDNLDFHGETTDNSKL